MHTNKWMDKEDLYVHNGMLLSHEKNEVFFFFFLNILAETVLNQVNTDPSAGLRFHWFLKSECWGPIGGTWTLFPWIMWHCYHHACRSVVLHLGSVWHPVIFFTILLHVHDFPGQELNLHPLQWKHRVLTTGLPEKPWQPVFMVAFSDLSSALGFPSVLMSILQGCGKGIGSQNLPQTKQAKTLKRTLVLF